jgi:LmbE family N-acetylglucosaminyl deacetylase
VVTPARLLAKSPWARARWLVLAPHQDDETLGAGALIAETAATGRLAAVAYLTDGSGSHPVSCRGLPGIRRREARLAIRRLGAGRVPVVDIGWQDARPMAEGSAGFARTCGRFAALLRRYRVDAIAVTAGIEPHCDHAAAHDMAVAAVASARRDIAVFGYHVWSDPPLAHPTDVIETRAMRPGIRLAALQAHRSQLSALFGPGFRLAPERTRMPACDRLYRERRA